MRGRTVIAIAHRLSTVRSFDRIVVLQAGRVVQDGPPDQLMRREGLYRELIEKEITRLSRAARGGVRYVGGTKVPAPRFSWMRGGRGNMRAIRE